MINNFYWIIEGKLAGMAMPTAARAYAYLEDADKIAKEEYQYEIQDLQSKGIKAVVTLTESALADTPLKQAGIDYLHIPIVDMSPPTMEQVQRFVAFVHDALQNNKPVVAHCLGGNGRTGTMLACYLVSQGYSSSEAIRLVRRQNPSAIETLPQEEAVIEYAVRHAKSSKE